MAILCRFVLDSIHKQLSDVKSHVCTSLRSLRCQESFLYVALLSLGQSNHTRTKLVPKVPGPSPLTSEVWGCLSNGLDRLMIDHSPSCHLVFYILAQASMPHTIDHH